MMSDSVRIIGKLIAKRIWRTDRCDIRIYRDSRQVSIGKAISLRTLPFYRFLHRIIPEIPDQNNLRVRGLRTNILYQSREIRGKSVWIRNCIFPELDGNELQLRRKIRIQQIQNLCSLSVIDLPDRVVERSAVVCSPLCGTGCRQRSRYQMVIIILRQRCPHSHRIRPVALPRMHGDAVADCQIIITASRSPIATRNDQNQILMIRRCENRKHNRYRVRSHRRWNLIIDAAAGIVKGLQAFSLPKGPPCHGILQCHLNQCGLCSVRLHSVRKLKINAPDARSLLPSGHAHVAHSLVALLCADIVQDLRAVIVQYLKQPCLHHIRRLIRKKLHACGRRGLHRWDALLCRRGALLCRRRSFWGRGCRRFFLCCCRSFLLRCCRSFFRSSCRGLLGFCFRRLLNGCRCSLRLFLSGGGRLGLCSNCKNTAKCQQRRKTDSNRHLPVFCFLSHKKSPTCSISGTSLLCYHS